MPPHAPLDTLLAKQHSLSLQHWKLPVLAEDRPLQQKMAAGRPATPAAPGHARNPNLNPYCTVCAVMGVSETGRF